MAGKRAEMLLTTMGLVDQYTVSRAIIALSQEEFDWEPHPGAWGVRRRDGCPTPNPMGEPGGEWVLDFDAASWEAAYRRGPAGVGSTRSTDTSRSREVVEPMTTIGWLLNHFGSAPGLAAELEYVGGPTRPTRDVYQRMWGYTVVPTVEEAVAGFLAGWHALESALATTATDESLELEYDEYPRKSGYASTAALINEVSHHGTQICALRDLYANQ